MIRPLPPLTRISPLNLPYTAEDELSNNSDKEGSD